MKLSIIGVLLIILFFTQREERKLDTGFYYVSEQETEFERVLDKSDELYYLNPEKIIGVDNFQDYMRIDFFTKDKNEIPELLIQLDSLGAIKWEAATRKALKHKLAFILNDNLIYVPTILSPISGGRISIWREEYDKNDLELIITKIRENKR